MKFAIIAEKPLEKYRQCDLSLVLLTFLLWGVGIVTLYISSGPFGLRGYNDSLYFVKKQLISSVIGFGLFALLAVIKMEVLKKWLPVIVGAALILSLVTVIPGIGLERNGARRWLKIGPMTFQASEAIKFVIIIYLANYFEKQSHISDEYEKTVFPAVLMTALMIASVILQQDMSTSIFLSILVVTMFWISGQKISWIFPVSLIVIPLAILFIVLEKYRLERIISFFNQDNEAYALGANFQINAARKAITAGGFWGQGLGSGLTRLNNIPEVQSDYIFAGWVEAMGFFGVISYFALLALFAWRGIVSAVTTSSRFAAVASIGFVVSIIMQSVINVAVVGGLMPTTGIPLPFFSQGGSSILVTFAACGFLVNASRITDDYENVDIEEVLYE